MLGGAMEGGVEISRSFSHPHELGGVLGKNFGMRGERGGEGGSLLDPVGDVVPDGGGARAASLLGHGAHGGEEAEAAAEHGGELVEAHLDIEAGHAEPGAWVESRADARGTTADFLDLHD